MSENIESILVEKRVFKPSASFAKASRVSSLAAYRKLHAASVRNPGKFWEGEARELVWQKGWTKAYSWKAPFAKWFVGGKLNVAENCLDRHVADPRRKNKAAINIRPNASNAVGTSADIAHLLRLRIDGHARKHC